MKRSTHPVVFALVLLVGLLAAADATGQTDWKLPTTADRVTRQLDAERQQAGSPDLERRSVLDAVASRRAGEVAALPRERRLAYAEPLKKHLDEAGAGSYVLAEERTFLLKGVEVVDGVMRQWRSYDDAWATAMSPDTDAVGAAVAHADDGWIVFVAILMQDPPTFDDLPTIERQIWEAINAVRQEHALDPLQRHAGLAETARAHSEDMARRDYMAHRSPEGERLTQRVGKRGISYVAVAENLAMHGGIPDPVGYAVDGWMQSRGHRRNILDPRYTHSGIGAAVSADGRLYITQVFLQAEP
jgi:uncharacterized protein YkwD